MLPSAIVGTSISYDQRVDYEGMYKARISIVRSDQGCQKFGPYDFAPAFSQPNGREGRANARRLARLAAGEPGLELAMLRLVDEPEGRMFASSNCLLNCCWPSACKRRGGGQAFSQRTQHSLAAQELRGGVPGELGRYLRHISSAAWSTWAAPSPFTHHARCARQRGRCTAVTGLTPST